ncbi:uncharacterized protein LOC17888463 isoform X2 [Capsella rubella]|uniref:uncharacterized protein LOC17888463 isoform X2 n=1 Tax=Capsella rubella TaxID=81985 RepID=UPI000CD57F9E|nr:uncharacterized protein LOC17888463 isoform X2 [Capsella rubella]
MGDPFGGRFGNFGGFRGSFFGGRDPFDDPFFSRPFEDLLEPPISFSSGASFSNAHKSNGGRGGLTIEELPSDEEVEERKGFRSDEEEHTSSVNQPSVEHPEDDSDAERKIQNMNQRSDFNRREGTQSRVNTFRHHTSKVTYGGIDGAYYTSTRTRRKGSDGMVVEESKEADKTTGEATHRISRGINDKKNLVALRKHGKAIHLLPSMNPVALIKVLEDGYSHLWTELAAEQTKLGPVQAPRHQELRRLFESTLNDRIIREPCINLYV